MATVGFIALIIVGLITGIAGIAYTLFAIGFRGFGAESRWGETIGFIIFVLILFGISALCWYNVFKHVSININVTP